MRNFKIIHIGKSLFWLSFLLGNICFFGFIITQKTIFAYAGFLLLIYAGIINAVVFLGLVIYAICIPKKCHEAFLSATILLINLPIAYTYAYIGLQII